MTEIRLWNTATKRKDPLEPLVTPGHPKMYVCGPTVYDRAHLGNARAAVVFDVLYRLLRHQYGDGVTYVRNFTDVDDKINAEAMRRRGAGAPGTLEELIRARSDETIRWYLEDMKELGVLEPDHMPRATEYIAQMVAMIEGLAERGFAYAAEGHVLFRVRKYADYGALSGRSVDDMIAGARVEVAPYKEDPMDFVLWKPSDDELPGWEGPVIDGVPVGRGRPGWHIECSAMAAELLGERFDIHGGGGDLIFPHHENEIAQSRCMGHDFARIWMHNEMLQVEGKKMSKSLGNFFTVRDLLDQGYPGEVIRFVMLSTHYRKPMDWTEAKAQEAEATLRKWYDKTHTLPESLGEVHRTVLDALSDDLNTHGAIANLHKLSNAGDWAGLRNGLRLLGLLRPGEGRPNWTRLTESSQTFALISGSPRLLGYEDSIDALAQRWAKLREAKNYAEADRLRDDMLRAGLAIKNTPNGPDVLVRDDFAPSKLEALK